MSNVFSARAVNAGEMNRLATAIDGTYIFPSTAGGAVTPSSGMTIAVSAIAAGTVPINGTAVTTAYAGGTVNVTAAHATLARRDLVYYDTSGAVGVSAGTAATIPHVPTLTSTQIAVAEIYIAAADTSVDTGDITDRRQGAMFDWTWLTKSATESVSNNTLQNDDEFLFTSTVNTDYLVEMTLLVETDTVADFKYSWALTNMTFDYMAQATLNDAAGAVTLAADVATASGTGISVACTTNTASGVWRGTFVIHSGATGGTVNFQWAEDTSSGTHSVLKNSTMRYRRLGAT